MSLQPPSALTVEANGLVNRLISPCRVSDVWDPDGSEPEPTAVRFNALWDTGATNTGISQRVVESLSLIPDGYVESHHAQGVAHGIPRFTVNLLLPPNVGVSGVQVAQVELLDGVDVLLGMDIINLGDFSVTNKDGKTMFSFIIPSQKHIDYTKDIDAANARAQAMGGQTRSSNWDRSRSSHNRTRRRRH